MHKIENEFLRLKKRYNLGKLNLHFDNYTLKMKGYEASFNPLLYEVILRDRRLCKKRFLALLHELCHVRQFIEGRLIQNKRNTRQMYLQEFEAEIFSIDEYEKLYAPRYGTCLNDLWDLAPYKEYQDVFKNRVQLGVGSKR